MGSINPIVVTEEALRARAGKIAEGLTTSVASFGGQLCTKPGVVFVPAGETGDAFAADLAARLDAAEAQVLLNERLRDALQAAVARLERHARPLGDAPAAGGPGFRYQPAAYEAPATAVADELLEEHFGPVVLLLRHGSREELLDAIGRIDGQLSGSLHAEPGEDVAEVVTALSERAGRVVFNGYPTGVAVTFGMHHGGPYPATTSPLHTSVGMTATDRFTRPIAFQDAPPEALPPELQEDNPLEIRRRIDGVPI
jgi:NADP-dependent aldehyde dehydrogenase